MTDKQIAASDKLLLSLCTRWGMTEADTQTFMSHHRESFIRINHLFQIGKIISALFRDKNVEREWMREKRIITDEETTVLDLLMEGSLRNILEVRFLVDSAANMA